MSKIDNKKYKASIKWCEATFLTHSPTMKDGKSVFVMTNMVITPRQHQTECPESLSDFKSEICTSDDNCTKGDPVTHGHGKIKKNNI